MKFSKLLITTVEITPPTELETERLKAAMANALSLATQRMGQMVAHGIMTGFKSSQPYIVTEPLQLDVPTIDAEYTVE